MAFNKYQHGAYALGAINVPANHLNILQDSIYVLGYNGPVALNYTSTGGLILGGESTSSYIEAPSGFSYTSTGGLTLGGESTASIPIFISSNGGPAFGGGASIEFLSAYPLCQITNCGCSDLHIDSIGGPKFGGTGVVEIVKLKGITVGGTSLNRLSSYGFDGLDFLIPLNTLPAVEIIKDLTLLDSNTTLVPGVFCLPATQFVGVDKSCIYIEKDSLTANQPFSVSFWAIPQSIFVQRALFVRGFNSKTNRWSLKISYGAFDHLVVSAQDTEYKLYERISTDKLSKERWNHIGVTYADSVIRFYLNGILQGTITMTGTMPASNGNSLGVHEYSSYPDAKMQEVRFYSAEKSAEYFVAEKNNFCNYDNFIIMGTEENPVLS